MLTKFALGEAEHFFLFFLAGRRRSPPARSSYMLRWWMSHSDPNSTAGCEEFMGNKCLWFRNMYQNGPLINGSTN